MNRSVSELLCAGAIALAFLLGTGATRGPAVGAEDDGQLPAAWASGPLDVVVAFPEAVPAEFAARLVGRSIVYARPSANVADPASASQAEGRLRIAGARLTDGGRTVLLATDPHPVAARYTLVSEGKGSDSRAIRYDLKGVEVTWSEGQEADVEPSWKGWWPDLDLASARRLAATSAPHEKLLPMLSRAGRLTLSALVTLPPGEWTVRIDSNRDVAEASLGEAVAEEKAATGRAASPAELSVRSRGEPQFLTLTVATGPGEAPVLRVVNAPSGRATFQPIAADRLFLPWVPLTPGDAAAAAAAVPDLGGGDAKRGEALFFGEQARCGQCHSFRGRGAAIGPELTDAVRKGRDYLYRSIAAPSAEIVPEYLPFTVAARDGRVLAGLVRAEGAEAIRVTDTAAKATVLRRDQVDQIRPSATSIMPVGLAGALGEPAIRDLLAYLLSPAGD